MEKIINVINPLFWLIVIIYFIYNKKYIRLKRKDKNFLYSIIITFLYITAYFLLGIYFGFAKSPYNHSIKGIINNIFIQIIPIIGIELLRTYIVLRNKNKKVIYFTTILLILLEINYKAIIDIFSNKKELFEYTCQIIIPTIINGILYTYLTEKTSYISSMIYRVNVKLVTLLMPILPNIDWFVSSSLNILSAIIIYLIYKYKLTKQREDVRQKKQNNYYKLSYAITIILLLFLICFMVGIFNYEPITILSNSMSPVLEKGDVVIYKKLNVDEIKDLEINSIILYRAQDRNIMHRIVYKTGEGENMKFETKGDNNNKSDEKLVQIDQIKGKYVCHIKYIGYLSVWLYDYFNLERED